MRHPILSAPFVFMRDGRGARTSTFDESFTFIESQIEKLRAWGGDDVLAIGSDLDGFIKPTLEHAWMKPFASG